MSRFQRHPFLTFVGILVLTLVALVAFRLVSSGAKKDPRKERVISVGTIVPVRKDLNVRLVYTADIQPYQQVNIFSRVDGYIAKIYVDKGDRKSTRLNSSHLVISYAVFCLKKKK